MSTLFQKFVDGAGRLVPGPARRFVRRIVRFPPKFKARMRSAFGLEPLSYLWGFDRAGTSIHRDFVHQFLRECSEDIRGHCLEFQEAGYTNWFGGEKVTKADVLHVDDSNPQATIVADLTKPNGIPSDAFDCIICTHVLHVIFELDKFVAEMRRLLKPGGVLLVAVPCVSMCDPDWHELWRFTEEGLHRVLAQSFGNENVTTRAYGNSLTAVGQLRGLVAEELSDAIMNYHDRRFAVEICARAVKRGPSPSANGRE